MGRWQPGAQGRLMQSAMELYVERGFEQTTAAEIAERAGVTERTFFRHFVDKREVLFGGAIELKRIVVAGITDAAAGLSPVDAVLVGMYGGAALIGENREWSRKRAALLEANPSLMERELLKLAGLGAAAADALRERGVADLAARLAGETGVTVFRIGFDTWVGDEPPGDFPACMRLAWAGLRELTAAP